MTSNTYVQLRFKLPILLQIFTYTYLQLRFKLSQGQTASTKFARCLRKRFSLREFFNANNYSITMVKQSQGEAKNSSS